jgi:hypothetical protein
VLLVATVALGTVKEYNQITPNLERPPMGMYISLFYVNIIFAFKF